MNSEMTPGQKELERVSPEIRAYLRFMAEALGASALVQDVEAAQAAAEGEYPDDLRWYLYQRYDKTYKSLQAQGQAGGTMFKSFGLPAPEFVPLNTRLHEIQAAGGSYEDHPTWREVHEVLKKLSAVNLAKFEFLAKSLGADLLAAEASSVSVSRACEPGGFEFIREYHQTLACLVK